MRSAGLARSAGLHLLPRRDGTCRHRARREGRTRPARQHTGKARSGSLGRTVASTRHAPLPDANSGIWSKIEFLPWLDIEGRIPGIHVAHFRGAVFARRMHIHQNLLTLGLLAHLGGPFLTEGEKELLLARQSLIRRRGLALQ